ncbi:MAG TPA: TonB-dependent siderophore receptor, partial [Vicinamibacteria bacterium]
GRGSTGGSVNLVSKTPQTGGSRSLAVGGGTDAYKRATLDLNQPIAKVPGAVFRLNGMFTDTDMNGRDAVTNRRWGVSPSLAFGLGSKTRFTLLYSHLDQDNLPDYGVPWVPAGTTGPLAAYAGAAPPVESSNFYGLTTRDYELTKTDVGTATFDHDFTPRMTLRNLFRYGVNDRDSVITAPRFVNASSPTQYSQINRQLQSRDMEDSVVSNQTTLTSRFATGRVQHALVSGLDFTQEDSINYLRTGPTAPVADLFEPNADAPYPGPITRTGAVNDARATTLGAFAFDTVQLGSKLELTGGLRYDNFDVDYDQTAITGVVTPLGRNDNLFSWRAGVVYKPQPHGSVYAGLGTSFNPSAEGLTLATTNVNLEPEKTQSFEVGSKWDLLDQRLSLTGAIFRTEKTNARTPGVNPGDPPQVLAGEQKVDGVELGAFGSLGSRATLFAGYAHMWSEIEASNTAGETGGALAQTPENTFNLWLTYRLPFELTLGGGVQYMDSVYRNALNTLQVPSYWLVNATAAYPITPKLTLRLNAYNLADEEYVDRVGGGHFVPGAGRYATLTVDLKF